MNAFQSRRWCMMMLVGALLLLLFWCASALAEYKPESPMPGSGCLARLSFACRFPNADASDRVKAAFIEASVKARDAGAVPDKVMWLTRTLKKQKGETADMTLVVGTLSFSGKRCVEKVGIALPHIAPLVDLRGVTFPRVQVTLGLEFNPAADRDHDVITLPQR